MVRMKNLKEVLRAMLLLFSGWMLLLQFLIYTAIYGLYLYITTDNVVLSLIIGGVLAFPSLYYISYSNKKMKKYHRILQDLNLYATTMTFHLQSNKNVRTSLEMTKPALTKELQEEVDLVLRSFDKDSLNPDFSGFEKYKFSPIDAFNDTLIISRNEGGNISEMFRKVNRNINYAITKHDEMIRGKKAVAKQIYSIIGMMGSIPVILSLMSAVFSMQIYKEFISYPISIIGVIGFFVGLVVCLFKHEKKKSDTFMYI
ncbi:hypothetical protein CHCC5025_1128 [Bacillus licheniformis]|nr:hypothetical protein CHCC5025_1128 [Bacillus licheniformis]TWJ82562.1 hypothetical protein CHCC20497_2032 [Bacillus paralicheniformis]TWK70906.1 hypothetical protein CHCC20342_2573 [Bacillus licheniformis]TWL14630.1 hypothetical protein CHCC16874_1674 [Bacillus licheniformis]TWL46251.1 hypothetical protein CHCC15543_4522 [Bacillus licheniformis]